MHIHICHVRGLGIVKTDGEHPETKEPVVQFGLVFRDEEGKDGLTVGEFTKTELLGFLNEACTALMEEE